MQLKFCEMQFYLKTPLTISHTSTTSIITIKPLTETSEPATNPTMKSTTKVTTTTTTTTTTPKNPTTSRKFEFGKIYKITTKTHDSDKAAMGNGGRLEITIYWYLHCVAYLCAGVVLGWKPG